MGYQMAQYIEDSTTGEKRKEKQNEKDIKALKQTIAELLKRIEVIEGKRGK